MNTEQTAQQLRLAADILETGHPWEYQPDNYSWNISQGNCPIFATQKGWPIRLILATPPDNRPLHNPGNLTAEQVGAGHRLLLEEESTNQPHELWSIEDKRWRPAFMGHQIAKAFRSTYRVPLSVPWPELPDPYAELKAAHAAGKVIQTRIKLPGHDWIDEPDPNFDGTTEYRIKPEPTFQLPPPPPGMQWHREDGWMAEMLPQGYRPLVLGELERPEDEQLICDSKWVNNGAYHPFMREAKSSWSHHRTRRPLTFTHEGKTWTYHRPGDPMPCEGKSNIHCMGGHLVSEHPRPAAQWFWNEKGEQEIFGWRYADETKIVPLGPEDVLPGSVVRCDNNHWFQVLYASLIGVCINNIGLPVQYSWTELAERWQINRSIPLTGKWNPDAWEPCRKPANPPQPTYPPTLR